ncbi:MAG: hypothetical protein HYX43_14220 [Burkholderiales bacterium]|nr:hypothetical protein [Burkholderiales bacterium]
MTRPHHTLFGREFDLVMRGQNWREGRAWFHDGAGCLRAVPANWTVVDDAGVVGRLVEHGCLHAVVQDLVGTKQRWPRRARRVLGHDQPTHDHLANGLADVAGAFGNGRHRQALLMQLQNHHPCLQIDDHPPHVSAHGRRCSGQAPSAAGPRPGSVQRST